MISTRRADTLMRRYASSAACRPTSSATRPNASCRRKAGQSRFASTSPSLPPHDPRTPPDRFKVDAAAVPLPGNFLPVHPYDNGDSHMRDERLEAFPRTPDAIRQHIADYYGMIAHMDDAIGGILSRARDRGLMDETVVVYTADHGLALGQHGLMGKQNLYEHSLHVPLMFAGPGIPAGRNADLVWHGDTRATVLDLAGLPVEADSEGVSLLPAMRGKANPRELFGAAFRMGQRTMRDRRYKLIRYYEQRHFPMLDGLGDGKPSRGSSVEQLFDLETDPEERPNLIFRPDMQEIRLSLSAALRDWQERCGDPMLPFLGEI